MSPHWSPCSHHWSLAPPFLAPQTEWTKVKSPPTTLFIQTALYLRVKPKVFTIICKAPQDRTFLWGPVLLLLLSLPSFCLTFRPSCSWPKAFAFNSHLFRIPAPTPTYWALSPFLHFFPQMPPFLVTLCNFTSPTHTLSPYYIFLLSTYQSSHIL